MKYAGICVLDTNSIGTSSSISNSAFSFTLPLIKKSALSTKTPLRNETAIYCPLSTSSLAKTLRLVNGLSRTNPYNEWSRCACSSAVTAPMLRPQSAMDPIYFKLRKYAITVQRSSFSKWPSVTKSPSLRPDPAKSKQKSVHGNGNTTSSYPIASIRELEFPWR